MSDAKQTVPSSLLSDQSVSGFGQTHEHSYQMLFDENPCPMWIYDLETLRFLAVNEVAIQHYGYSRLEFLKMTIEQIRPAETIPLLHEAISKLRDAESYVSHSWQHYKSDGSLIEVEVISRTIKWFDRPARLVLAQDITQRRKTEKAVKFQAGLLDMVQQAVVAIDWPGNIIYWNRYAVSLLGWTVEEAMSQPAYVVFPPQATLKERTAEFLESLGSGKTWIGEASIPHRDGYFLQVEITSSPYYDEDGQNVGIVTLLNNISERKQAEQRLRESEDRYRRLAEALPQMVWINGPDYKITYANQRCYDYMGANVEELIKYGPHPPIIQPDDWERNNHIWQEAVKLGLPHEYESRMLDKNGTYQWFLHRAVPLKDETTGQIISWFGTSTNIEALKQAEHRLRESQERYRLIVETSYEGIWLTDLKDQIVFVNSRLLEMLGYSQAEELLGQSCFNFVYEADVIRAEQRMQERRLGLVGQSEIRYKHKDGHAVWTLTSSNPLVDAQGHVTGMLGVSMDTTQRRQAEHELRRSEEELRQAQKVEAIGKLAGGIAHDFNNILAAIMGYADLALSALKPESRYLQEDIDEIKHEAERAAALTRQLLAYSRRQILQPRRLNLNEVVGGMEKLLRRLIGEDIEITLRLGSGLGKVEADPSQLEQVIMNLALNARDAMPTGGQLTIETSRVVLTATAYMSEQNPRVGMPAGEYILLTISDTGFGMDEAVQRQIFEPFFTTKGRGNGTGLGLSTVYGIVKQSDGFIWVDSAVGQGSVFRIYFHALESNVDGPPESSGLINAVAAQPVTPSSKSTILVVEDEAPLRVVIRKILQRGGYQVLEAQRGDEALEIIRRHTGPLDLLLTDVIMPGGLNGPELADHFARLRPHTPIIFMSGYTDGLLKFGELESGDPTFLQKPFTSTALLEQVRAVLENRIPFD